jgi:hypothetical protein
MKRLWTTLRYTYTGLRGSILGWGLGIGLYGLMITPMYETLAGKGDAFQKMVASYPPEFLAFFGASVTSMLTPDGFLGMYAFSMMPLIIGIFAVIVGSNLIIFFGRMLGAAGAAVSVMLLGWLGFSLLLSRSSLGFNMGEMIVPFLPLLIQILFYISLALMLSMCLPSRNLAAMVTGVVMVLSYFISSLAFLDERMATASKLMPYHYFQTVLSFDKLNLTWLFALLGISLLMILIAWHRFLQRDIRLSGEGSWRLPRLFKRRKITLVN